MHEILISEEEIHHCVKSGDYYTILPMLPELVDKKNKEPNVFTKEFSSADNTLDLNDTIELLKKHKLMRDDVVLMKNELLR